MIDPMKFNWVSFIELSTGSRKLFSFIGTLAFLRLLSISKGIHSLPFVWMLSSSWATKVFCSYQISGLYATLRVLFFEVPSDKKSCRGKRRRQTIMMKSSCNLGTSVLSFSFMGRFCCDHLEVCRKVLLGLSDGFIPVPTFVRWLLS